MRDIYFGHKTKVTPVQAVSSWQVGEMFLSRVPIYVAHGNAGVNIFQSAAGTLPHGPQ